MAYRERILILTGSLGDGHNKAAQAILEAAQLYRPDVEVKVVDYLKWTYPKFHKVGNYCFIQGVKSLPSLYGFLYRRTREDNAVSHLFKRMRLFNSDRMLELLDEVRPTEVVSTFPGAAAAMSYLKVNGLTNVSTATVLTDYTDHSYWIHPCTDRYLVGAEQVKKKLLRYPIADHQIVVTGIPLRQQFTQSYDRYALREKYGLDRMLPTVLIMGGGHGMIGKELMSVLQTGDLSAHVQFIFVCGRNERLKQRLEQQLDETHHHVLITGYVDDVHELMALSDMIITKPGGLTVSEALALGLPMMLYKPIPGQEQDNAEYLVSHGAAMEVNNRKDLRRQLHLIIHNETLLYTLKKNAASCHLKTAAHRALTAILDSGTRPQMQTII